MEYAPAMFNRTIRALSRIVQHESLVFARIARRQPVVFPPLEAATLDPDDVSIARHLLEDRRSWADQGIVEEYQRKFCGWNGSKYAFAFASGRVALSACIQALDLGVGDEVIVPGYTCVAVPNAFHFAGLRIVYSDIELDTYGLDASVLEKRITSATRAVLVQHSYGLVCRDYLRILEIARKHSLKVIEDCAHAAGAEYGGAKVGNLGDAAIYSSEQSKVFSTIQGGMAVTNDPRVAGKLENYHTAAPLPGEEWIARCLRNVIYMYYVRKHPGRWLWEAILPHFHRNNWIESTTAEELKGRRPADYGRRMPAPLAAVGLNQLRKVDRYNEGRRQMARRWDTWCDQSGFQKPLIAARSTPVFLRYPVRVGAEMKRDTAWAVSELRVQPGVWFSTNIHPADWPVDGCPNADRAVAECINLPTVPA